MLNHGGMERGGGGAWKRNNAFSQIYLNSVLFGYILSSLTPLLNSLALKIYKLTLYLAKSVKE